MALLLSLAGCGGRDNAANVGDKEAVVSEAADAGTPEISETLPQETAAPAASTVYFTAGISPEGLVKAYEALNWTPTGKTADSVEQSPDSAEASGDTESGVSQETPDDAAENPLVDAPKILVAYFSATGTTKGVAENLAAALNADIYEIVPQEPYTAEDLNYNDRTTRATVEQNMPSLSFGICSRPLRRVLCTCARLIGRSFSWEYI